MMRATKNAHGNVLINEVPRALLGSKTHPMVVHRGERADAAAWMATFQGLPGYLGIGATPALAIDELWGMLGDGPIYDVSKSRGLEPTSENIRKLLERAVRLEAAKDEARALGTQKDTALVAVGASHSISRNTLKQGLAATARWERIGGMDKVVQDLGIGQWQQAMHLSVDPQAFFEQHPARAAAVLARQKFPMG